MFSFSYLRTISYHFPFVRKLFCLLIFVNLFLLFPLFVSTVCLKFLARWHTSELSPLQSPTESNYN